MPMQNEKVVIMGLGNILCGDDGFGVHVVQRLYEELDLPGNVEVVDGGTRGSALYCHIEAADRLLIFDAVDFGLPCGELARREGPAIPGWIGARKMSAHQNSFAELLAIAGLKNVMPRHCVLIGLQPEQIEFGRGPGALAASRIDEALALGLECLHSWGIFPQPARRPKNLLHEELLASAYCPGARARTDH